ncbi:ubiquinone biosynthesis accessory factor UbiJ [Kushneria aurantia]|uniref:Ubiquinone biosynthesis accessory factor UbiJ n=1 Tax=Kushneria aurantia TaxID=504092 RepID=A0ABV6G505_9GAMM|nr:SCP2 sterol-binding domain-containing protein [Kushneria aurantia]
MSFVTHGLLRRGEQCFNRLLARDPAATTRLRSLAGQRLVVALASPPLRLAIDFTPEGVHLAQADEASWQSADSRVELDGDSLGALLGGTPVQSLMTQNRLIVHGSLATLMKARELVMDLDMDAEGALARWLGESPAHGIATGLARLGRFGRDTSQSFEHDLRAYMIEEGEWLASRDLLDIARARLTRLEVASDRLEARLDRLTRQRGEGPAS